MTEQPSPVPQIPKFDGHSLLLYFWENWAAIRKHWMLFAIATAVCALAAGYLVHQYDSHQIDILTTSNTQLRDHNAALMQNAGASPPSQWRRLTDGERSVLIQLLKQWPAKPKSLPVFAMAESESRQYAAQFFDVLRAADIEPRQLEVSLSLGAPVETGLMVGVIRFEDPPPEAREFLQILNKAGLSAHFTIWNGGVTESSSFDLWVGPKPW